MRLGKLMSETRDQIVAAHDLSDGGLAVAITEMALASKIGVVVNISENHFVHLFSETPGRILIAIESDQINEFVGRAIDCEITTTRIGKTGGDEINFENLFSISIAEMSKVNCATLPRLFG
jgi:phosphoribosylformylglycinamidine synthase